MRKILKGKIKPAFAALALLASLAVVPTSIGAQDQSMNDMKPKGKVVYVCACLKDKSCSCMTEAKTEGPCSCGTEGGPPMKAVSKDSAWAKANRDALAH